MPAQTTEMPKTTEKEASQATDGFTVPPHISYHRANDAVVIIQRAKFQAMQKKKAEEEKAKAASGDSSATSGDPAIDPKLPNYELRLNTSIAKWEKGKSVKPEYFFSIQVPEALALLVEDYVVRSTKGKTLGMKSAGKQRILYFMTDDPIYGKDVFKTKNLNGMLKNSEYGFIPDGNITASLVIQPPEDLLNEHRVALDPDNLNILNRFHPGLPVPRPCHLMAVTGGWDIVPTIERILKKNPRCQKVGIIGEKTLPDGTKSRDEFATVLIVGDDEQTMKIAFDEAKTSFKESKSSTTPPNGVLLPNASKVVLQRYWKLLAEKQLRDKGGQQIPQQPEAKPKAA